jgi:hypothetical protein
MEPRFEADLTTSLDAYKKSCIDLARTRMSGFNSISEIAQALDDLNAYPRLESLSEPRDVRILDEKTVTPDDLDQAGEAVVEGRFFCEHTAAGEATRLKLGAKFLINPALDLTVDGIAELLSDEIGREVSAAEAMKEMEVAPQDLLPFSLGERHMLQIAFEIYSLAQELGYDPVEVLGRQKTLVVLNEKTAAEILEKFKKANFFGFDRNHIFFMTQATFPGINLKDGDFFFDHTSPARLHNHGQLVMQETMDDQIFFLDDSNRPHYLSAAEFGAVLDDALDKISYNIEDLGYLTGAIDWPSLAMALKLGGQGYRMVMEIVANNPEKPQKGGLAAFDEVLGKNVMVESFQLKDMANEDIIFLNKNFNHFPVPKDSWLALKKSGLPMPLTVKDEYLYFQPIQGDINFLVQTSFIQRSALKPIQSWKSAAGTPAAVKAMARQDTQAGFKEFAQKTFSRTG